LVERCRRDDTPGLLSGCFLSAKEDEVKMVCEFTLFTGAPTKAAVGLLKGLN